ncbi:tripartite tricarboxylate transporter substrate-binding protein [Roseomonas sp. CCTCC AB2023176]|uniref:Bug family tripartite tricarboxylate transporter substrate binding protein n=1 Tax=Roseomonas sp. CCTCC AB2023176 TaxID=3342640 RepID=UPI0035DB35BB
MKTTRRDALLIGAALAAPAILPGLARAQANYPSRPVRLIVPFAGGGATDLTARLIAERLGGPLGQPVVVDNRPGAGGNLGADLVAKSDPDGHTLLMCTIGTASINQFLYSRLPYDPARDLTNVALVNEVANGIIIQAENPARTLDDLLAQARRQPGALNYGTPGNGTSGHLCGEYLKTKAGVDLTHVPYRGTGQVIPDLLGGRLQLAVDNLPAYLPHIRDGRLRCLAVTSKERWFSLPDVPTVVQAGIPDFEAVAWFGVQAPGRTPRPIVERLAGHILDIVRDPVAAERLREIGSAPSPSARPTSTATSRRRTRSGATSCAPPGRSWTEVGRRYAPAAFRPINRSHSAERGPRGGPDPRAAPHRRCDVASATGDGVADSGKPARRFGRQRRGAAPKGPWTQASNNSSSARISGRRSRACSRISAGRSCGTNRRPMRGFRPSGPTSSSRGRTPAWRSSTSRRSGRRTRSRTSRPACGRRTSMRTVTCPSSRSRSAPGTSFG